MEKNSQSDEFLDRLLSEQPVQPSAGFSDKVMQALSEEDALDAIIDQELSRKLAQPSAQFTEQVLKEALAEGENKILGFPAWAVTLGTIAALLVAGIMAFAAMINKAGDDLAARKNDIASSANQSISDSIAGHDAQPDAEPTAVAAVTDMTAWEELMLMQQELEEIAELTDAQQWETLAMLAN